MSAPLTDTQMRLVEQYVSVLDYLSRCAQAIDTDDWFYLADKARQLEYAAEQLTDVAQQLWNGVQQGQRPARGLLAAEVAIHARHYRAVRLLHPIGSRRRGGGSR
jgi:hypothetical protein